MRRFLFAAIALIAAGMPAWAQTPADALRAPRTALPPEPGAAAVRGPTVFIVDNFGNLATVDIGQQAVHIIGNTHQQMTDIGFTPDGALYGVSFTSLYKINPKTARATFVGDLGPSDINALVFDSSGNGYVEGNGSSTLYTVDLNSGQATPIGRTGAFTSAGDLVFYNDQLVLAGQRNFVDYLVTIDPASGKVASADRLSLLNLFGLVSTGKNELFGFADSKVYKLVPNGKSVRQVVLFDMQTKIQQVFGAAYNGNFQP